MSSIQLDGTHTPVKRGGQAVGYQSRKKCKTSNMLLLTDNNGIPLACSEAIAGNHNDAFQLEEQVDKMLKEINKSKISVEGLFLNADSGFDTQSFRTYLERRDITANIDSNPRNEAGQRCCVFDELLYKRRFVIERTHAWIDGFKCLLIRFETNKKHWEALFLLAFSLILLRKL